MELEKLKRCTDWFKVHSIKDLDDPSKRVGRKELVVSLDQYPFDFGLGPNPREPVLTSPVSKKIGETLAENWQNFHLLNRGVTLVAKSLDYDNKSQRVRLVLDEAEEEKRYFGILDGGNTNARINEWRTVLSGEEAAERLTQGFVNVQVLLPQLKGASEPTGKMFDLLNDIKEARNTSVQVKTKSLADARKHFETLKSVMKETPYYNDMSWHEGQPGSIDALQIVIFLMMYYPSFCSAAGGEPSNAYGHKERCLDAFLEYAASEPDELAKWMRLLPTMIDLFDELQTTFPDHYEGRFGKIKEVQIYDQRLYERGNKKYRKSPMKSMFLGKEMKYSYPVGWLYPLFAAFRFLAASDKSGKSVTWKRDPVEFWKLHGQEICERYMPHIIAAGYEPKTIATNPLSYQAVRQAVSDLFKDDLLREAGIAV
jgi:hypothetical protein